MTAAKKFLGNDYSYKPLKHLGRHEFLPVSSCLLFLSKYTIYILTCLQIYP